MTDFLESAARVTAGVLSVLAFVWLVYVGANALVAALDWLVRAIA